MVEFILVLTVAKHTLGIVAALLVIRKNWK